MTIYLGNLPPDATEEAVRGLFAAFGPVQQVTLITDPETGEPRGFGFVVMADEAAGAAIEALDGAEFAGAMLRVNEARDRGAKPPRRAW
ncbi:MAG: RNA recognition motif domain-containing protein [Candidatus Krumholzibacteriia bacterium]